MRFDAAAAAIATTLLCGAQPASAAAAGPSPGPDMRLVQTSDSDPGEWVPEKELFARFTSKGVGFIDVTHHQREDVEPNIARRQASTFPDKAEHQDEANKMIAQVDVSKPQAWPRTLTEFPTRHYQSPSGKEAAEWVFKEAQSVAGEGVNVTQFPHSKWDQPSVIAAMAGSRPDTVVVGAHLDSTGGTPEARSPGADDNGSGTVVVLEALRVLSSSGFKPNNTLEFHFYAAEEPGLLGSMDIFSKYKSDGRRVVAMLNQDMAGGKSSQSSVITDFVDPALAKYVGVLGAAYMDSKPSESQCRYACSDHHSALKNGFPSAMMASEEIKQGSSDHIHGPQDSLDKIEWSTVERHAKFVVGFMVEASNIEGGGGTGGTGGGGASPPGKGTSAKKPPPGAGGPGTGGGSVGKTKGTNVNVNGKNKNAAAARPGGPAARGQPTRPARAPPG